MPPLLADVGHAVGGFDPLLLGVLLLAGIGTSLVAGLALAAFLRRRSRPYLLVALAVLALVARTAVAAVALSGGLPAETHHLLEHGLDVVMVALVVAAVYTARTEPTAG
jgi:hypothetical protein